MSFQKIVDKSGNLIPTLLKSSSGGIAVDDLNGYNLYMKIKKQQETIESLKDELSSIKELVGVLVDKIDDQNKNK